MKSPAFNLSQFRESCWPTELRPIGESSSDKESFESWWTRSQSHLSHLPSDLCEQWIYRHWTHSRFDFLPLASLSWERQSRRGEELLRSVYRVGGNDLHPQHDYETFHRRGGEQRHPTAHALDSGTWDFPMVLLSTPHGVVDLGKTHLEVRLVVIEGHQRHRYLNALHELGKPPKGPHEIIVLSSPLVTL